MSISFIQLVARRLGLDWAAQYYEKQYLKYRRKSHRRIILSYNTGKSNKDPRSIFKYYNDGKTMPSSQTILEARKFFRSLTEDIGPETKKVKRIARWVNENTDYQRDSVRWGNPEYWSSPFDLWKQFQEEGRMEDDCDGYAAIMVWACWLIGVPEERCFMWAGDAMYNDGRGPFGHSNMLYDSISEGFFHVEGSFYARDNQRNWGDYTLNCERYPRTWFYFNKSYIAKYDS